MVAGPSLRATRSSGRVNRFTLLMHRSDDARTQTRTGTPLRERDLSSITAFSHALSGVTTRGVRGRCFDVWRHGFARNARRLGGQSRCSQLASRHRSPCRSGLSRKEREPFRIGTSRRMPDDISWQPLAESLARNGAPEILSTSLQSEASNAPSSWLPGPFQQELFSVLALADPVFVIGRYNDDPVCDAASDRLRNHHRGTPCP